MVAKPRRYRDVLAMLKQMARDERVTTDGLRAVLAGNIGEGYTQADIARTHELAAAMGWELATEPSEADTENISFDTPERYRDEIRRLHALLRSARAEAKELARGIALGQKKAQERNDARRKQLDALGVRSIDEAFALLRQMAQAVLDFGAHEIDICGFLFDESGEKNVGASYRDRD